MLTCTMDSCQRSWNGMSSVYTILKSTTLESDMSEGKYQRDVWRRACYAQARVLSVESNKSIEPIGFTHFVPKWARGIRRLARHNPCSPEVCTTNDSAA